VTLSMSCLTESVRGLQAFLSFDENALTFIGGDYTNEPFGLPIIDPITADGGDIDLASGIDDANGQEPTTTSAGLATLSFVAGTLEGPTNVSFRGHEPPTRFSDEFGNEIVPGLLDSPTILVDGTPPVITCPDDIGVHADAGGCTASVDPGLATAVDNFDPDPAIEYKRSDRPDWNDGLLDPYPSGTTEITWRAIDCAGNLSECTQTVEVSDQNELFVQIALAGVVDPGPFTRCITFELWDCDGSSSVMAEDVLTFTDGSASATVLVPCGEYECVTARDRLHTLRSMLDSPSFQIVGTQYVADFQAAGKDLISGDLNDDGSIDALDFGVFTFQWNTIVGADTDCATPYPHADVDGNGIVGTEDFTFIQIHFMSVDEDHCCGTPSPGSAVKPETGAMTPEYQGQEHVPRTFRLGFGRCGTRRVGRICEHQSGMAAGLAGRSGRRKCLHRSVRRLGRRLRSVPGGDGCHPRVGSDPSSARRRS